MKEFDSINRIQELCKERKWSYYQLSKVSGIAYSTLSTMINKQNAPSLPTLQKLCNGFGISITDFFEPDRSSRLLTKDQSECLSLFTSLSPEDKKLAIAYLKGLSKTL
ncbi:MAG: helix-turn-helix transcriptional regulator [Eubacterium sp.]|jgi:transcriptional regulator with XRE-family HTH domain|nr:helix-turn-helix transcriptional regulator [Eubacterium sp.]